MYHLSLHNQLPANFSRLDRRMFLKYGSLAAVSSAIAACNNGNKAVVSKDGLQKINLGLSWVAEAEYGGFYQAVAQNIYQDHGLDVRIDQGGPRMNGGVMLMTGAWDFVIGTALEAITAIETGVPKVTVASIFQRNIQVLIAHPNTGITAIPQLKGRPIYIASAGAATFWPFFRNKYGFTDNQRRAYKFDIKPFLADKKVVQQGILTSEPFSIEKEGKIKPVVMLMADAGYNPYDFTIETTKRLVETRADLVQKFVDASIKGWYSYQSNPAPGNALIKKDNPEMTDDLLAYSLERLKEKGILTSGEAATSGIGAMTDQRWKTLFDDMVKAGVYKASTNYQDAYTLKFVNKGTSYYQKS
jgi:NitT/TauT family transport system substrate-binding protein